MIKGQLGLELVFISLDCITIFLNITKFTITVMTQSLVERPAFDKQLHVRPDVMGKILSRDNFNFRGNVAQSLGFESLQAWDRVGSGGFHRLTH